MDDDSVFAVKDSLVVEFVPRKDDSKASLELKYDVAMAPVDKEGNASVSMATSGTGLQG